MSIKPTKLILFDFDDVILESGSLKSDAFVAAYAGEDRERVEAVARYQLLHGGIGRREKFRHFETALFGRSGDDASLDHLCREFSAYVEDRMLVAPMIAGAWEALDWLHGRLPLHLVSGMPKTELVLLLEKRGLASYFKSVAGSPETKRDAFQRILESEGCAPGEALAVGDSLTEFHAAETLGIPFLAVVAEGRADLFPERVEKVKDLSGFLSRFRVPAFDGSSDLPRRAEKGRV